MVTPSDSAQYHMSELKGLGY